MTIDARMRFAEAANRLDLSDKGRNPITLLAEGAEEATEHTDYRRYPRSLVMVDVI